VTPLPALIVVTTEAGGAPDVISVGIVFHYTKTSWSEALMEDPPKSTVPLNLPATSTLPDGSAATEWPESDSLPPKPRLPEVMPVGGIEFRHEDIRIGRTWCAPSRAQRPASQIDGVGKAPREQHVAGGIGAIPPWDRGFSSEAFAPDVIAIGVVFYQEDLLVAVRRA
jgi:hypothetical protein